MTIDIYDIIVKSKGLGLNFKYINSKEGILTIEFPQTAYSINEKESFLSEDGKIWNISIDLTYANTPLPQPKKIQKVNIPKGVEKIVFKKFNNSELDYLNVK